METINAGNNINIILINTDKFKTITICVLLHRPLHHDEATVNALIPGILKRGSKKYNSLASINARLEEMYGAIFDAQIVKKGEEQILQFSIELIKSGNDSQETAETLRRAFNFLSEIITEPLTEEDGFSMAYTSGEITNLKNTIGGRINNKTEYAKLRCIEEMCADEPFGVYADGYMQDLDGLTPQGVYVHYRKILAESPLDFVIIGDVDGELIKNLVLEYFAFERHNIITIPQAKLNYNKKDAAIKEEDTGSSQGKLCMGLRSGIEPVGSQLYHLITAGEILGGSPSSKLFVNIREKESLCYYINSFVFRFKTILFIQSGVEKENLSKTVELINKEVEALKQGTITESELEIAKKSLVKRLRGIKDYPSSTMDFYVTQYMLGDDGTIESAIEIVEQTGIDNIKSAAANLYTDSIFILK